MRQPSTSRRRWQGREAVLLDNGTTLTVDHVVLTSGHTWNQEREADGGVRYLQPYPIECLDQSAPAGSSVAVAGMGLVGFDVLTALTVGRGGTFEDRGDRADRLRYVPSGREPAITLYSRSGAPYCAKSATGVDPYGQYQPVVCTPEEFAALTNPGGSPVRRHVDFRAELLPLIFAEMQARYYIQAALLAGGDVESTEVRTALRQGWVNGHYEKVVDGLEPRYGRFDPAAHLFAGSDRHYTSAADYQGQAYDMIDDDLTEALRPGGSPVKAAQEVLRILRDQLRSVIEFGGLSLDSYVEFQSNVRGRINRLEAGVPPMRSQQLLAPARRRGGAHPARTRPGVGPLPRRRPAEFHGPRRADGSDGRRRGPGLSRHALAGPVGLAPAQPPLRQGTADPAQLRRHPGRQRGHQRGHSTPTTPRAGSSPTSPCWACSPKGCATSPTTCPRPAAASGPSTTPRTASSP